MDSNLAEETVLESEGFLIATDIISNHKAYADRLSVSPQIEAAAQLLENFNLILDDHRHIDFMSSFLWFQIEKNELHYIGRIGSETVWFQRNEGHVCDVPFVLKLLIKKENEIPNIVELKLQVEDSNLPDHIKKWKEAGETQNSLKELSFGLYSFYCNAKEMYEVTAQLEGHANIQVDCTQHYSRRVSIFRGNQKVFAFSWKIIPSEHNMSMEHVIKCSKSDYSTPQILVELKKISSLEFVSELPPLFLEIARLVNL